MSQVENAYFELRILNDDARKIFALSPTNGTRSAAVSVVVLEPRFLDYEKPQYRNRVIEVSVVDRWINLFCNIKHYSDYPASSGSQKLMLLVVNNNV